MADGSRPVIMMGGNLVWRDECAEMLRQLWAEGATCSVIAARLNATFGTKITRNAVIGKSRRLKLPQRAVNFSHAFKMRWQPGRKKSPPRSRTRRATLALRIEARQQAETNAVPLPILPSPQARPTTFLELDSGTCCHWVIGNEGQGPNTLMCGAPQQKHNPVWAGPYCAFHSGLAIRGTKGGDAATTIKQQQNHPLKNAGADGGEQKSSASGSFAEVPFDG